MQLQCVGRFITCCLIVQPSPLMAYNDLNKKRMKNEYEFLLSVMSSIWRGIQFKGDQIENYLGFITWTIVLVCLCVFVGYST